MEGLFIVGAIILVAATILWLAKREKASGISSPGAPDDIEPPRGVDEVKPK
jgi:hypothetical protein